MKALRKKLRRGGNLSDLRITVTVEYRLRRLEAREISADERIMAELYRAFVDGKSVIQALEEMAASGIFQTAEEKQEDVPSDMAITSPLAADALA